ncbi:MAG: ABC transporter permease subunit [Thermoleophilaceae bacterium]
MAKRDPALSAPAAAPAWRAADLLALTPALTLLGLLFAGALAGALKVSLVPLGGDLGDASLESWDELLGDPAFVDGLLFTLRIALISTAAAALAGVGLALTLRRCGIGLRALAALPVPVPHLLVAVVAVVWLAPGGLADRLLGGLPLDLIRDPGGVGVIAVYVYKEAPFIALLVLAALGRSLEQREEAAQVLGAGRLQRAAWVLWPAIRGPLVIGSVVVAAFAIGAFEVPLAVGPNHPPTLATYAFEATRGDLIAGEGRAAAALLVAGLLALVLAATAVRFARSVEGE